MKLTDLNPRGGIGANSLLVETGPFRFAVDSGLHPKFAGNKALPDFSLVKNDSLDFIILTHCHLDHLGSLPILSRENPRAPVLTSQASRILACRMLNNSIAVMKRQRAELDLPEYPLYGRGDVTDLRKRFQPLAFGRPFGLEKNGENLEVTFHLAGHVAGAASCSVCRNSEKIFFTGDVLFNDQRTLPGAKPSLDPIDVLVMETTRGLTERPAGSSREAEIVQLLQDIRKVLKRGGSALIPVFALGRMQEMLVILEEARRKGAIPPSPVFCSGLGMDLVNHFHDISAQAGHLRFSRKVLKSLGVRHIPRRLQPGQQPHDASIYLVSSGMLVANTPSYVLASGLLGNDRNAILFVGYCDPDTPGGKLLETKNGDDFVFETIDHVEPVRARIRQYDLSGHADRDELIALAERLSPKTRSEERR
ncbi:MAG: MBL fold metallo-hydrolase, partial [Opitutales bacterium]